MTSLEGCKAKIGYSTDNDGTVMASLVCKLTHCRRNVGFVSSPTDTVKQGKSAAIDLVATDLIQCLENRLRKPPPGRHRRTPRKK